MKYATFRYDTVEVENWLYRVVGTRDRILYGHSFRNITGTATMDQCFAKCLQDCKCLSFQICDNDKICQLCSSNREQNEESLQLGKGCTSFVFGKEQSLRMQVSRKTLFKSLLHCFFFFPHSLCFIKFTGTLSLFKNKVFGEKY